MIQKTITQGPAQKPSNQVIDMKEHYKNLIKKWVYSKFQLPANRPLSRQDRKHYEDSFMPEVYELTKLNIVFDKRAYQALLSLLQQVGNIKIRNHNYQNQMEMENADKIVSIAEELTQRNFITKSMLSNIRKIAHPDNSLQAILNRITQQVERDKISFQNQDKLQQIWEKHLPDYNFETIWTIIGKNLDKLDKNCIQKIFKIFKRKLSSLKKNFSTINIQLQFDTDGISQSQLLIYLANLESQSANKIVGYSPAQLKNLIDIQLLTLYKKLTDSIHQKYSYIQPKFELFGSYRSGFYINGSDFDITIFCRNAENNENQRNYDVLRTIQEDFKYREVDYASQIDYISRAKVPVLKLKLRNKFVRYVDIVLNNAHGVQNSRFFQSYSADPSIKQFGIMIKKWAKAYDLIGIKKFSSYCFILMMLYYLIRKGKLLPAKRIFIYQKKKVQNEKKRGNRFPETQNYKTKVQSNFKLQNQIQIYYDFIGFLQFYSEGGQFLRNGEVVCLLEKPKVKQLDSEQGVEGGRKNCIHMHGLLTNQNFIINVHDPFDDSNPGRMNKQGKRQFFDAIQDTLRVLKSKDKKAMRELFMRNTQNN